MAIPRRTIITFLVLVAILAIVSMVQRPTEPSGGAAEHPVSVFLYNPSIDTDEAGNVLCSERGLIAVERRIPDAGDAATLAASAVRALIGGGVTEHEHSSGIMNEFPIEGFSLLSSELHDEALMLVFNDEFKRASGGSCRVGILRAMIKATASQFSGINNVYILPEDILQP